MGKRRLALTPAAAAMRQARWLMIAVTIAAGGLSACGGDGRSEGGSGSTVTATVTVTPTGDSQPTSAVGGDREPILIRTQVKNFAGKVLAGSVVGESLFCPGGTVRHEHGSPDIGFPAIGVFLCPDGQLRIGFGPGPDQMNNTVQTSDWKILGGSGRFAGMSGDGQMIVQFDRAHTPQEVGHETFTGMVAVP